MQERRKSPRVKYPCTIVLMSQTGQDERVLTAENLSAYGARVVLKSHMEINSSVKVILEIDQKRIETKGRIVWTLQSTDYTETVPKFDTGIEFLNLSPEDKDFIIKLVEKKSD